MQHALWHNLLSLEHAQMLSFISMSVHFTSSIHILPFISMTKMIVCAGGVGGDTVTDGYVPTIGRDGLKHRFCVETAKVCGTDRWPPAVKAEL